MTKSAAQLKEDWHAADDAGDFARRADIGAEMARRFPDDAGCNRRAILDAPDRTRGAVIVFGPQCSGKTHNAERMAAHFGCRKVVDNWTIGTPITPGALHLTNEDPAGLSGTVAPRIHSIHKAAREAGFEVWSVAKLRAKQDAEEARA